MSQRESKPLGLIAGGGALPVLIAKEAAKNNRECVVALFKNSDQKFKSLSNNSQEFNIGELQRILDFMNKNDVSELCMAGHIDHGHAFNSESFDELMVEALSSPDNRAESVLKRIATIIERECCPVASIIDILKDHVVQEENLTSRELNEREKNDLEFGWNLSRDLAQLNVGQTIMIKNGVVLAVEAIEGTDNMIERCGQFDIANAFVIKVPMKNKDPRFDVPVIGPRTIESMNKVNAKALAVASFETLIMEREETIAAAKASDIAIVSKVLYQ